MSVSINESRKCIPIDITEVTGDTFTIRATNQGIPADGDAEAVLAADDKAHSSGPHPLQPNADGVTTFIESFPYDFESNVFIEVTGNDGSRTQGTISVY